MAGGACKSRGSHSRGYPAPGLDKGAGRCTRAPRCRREAAPVLTAVKRKWRRELAHASRGLEEPRPRGPAGDTRLGVATAPFAPPPSRAAGSLRASGGPQVRAQARPTPAEGPGGSGPGEPEEDSKDASVYAAPTSWWQQLQHTTELPGRPVPAALAAHRKRPARVTACDPRASATDGSSVGMERRLGSWMEDRLRRTDCFRPNYPEPEAGAAVANQGGTRPWDCRVTGAESRRSPLHLARPIPSGAAPSFPLHSGDPASSNNATLIF